MVAVARAESSPSAFLGAGGSAAVEPVTGSKEMGDFGERVAAHRLESIGCKILARNVRTASGEIDIIVRDGEDVAFVEVRTRRADPGTAAESLDEKKLQRMWRCAMEYCDTIFHGRAARTIFDDILISRPRGPHDI